MINSDKTKIETVPDRMRRLYHSFSKGQKAIAAYLLHNYEAAAYMTAAKIGEAAGVSESTVVRFAGELGFEGFPAFQSQLRDDLKANLTAAERMRASDYILTDETSVLKSVLTADYEQLKKAADRADDESFNRAVEMIAGAGRIFILGVRSAAPLASFLHFYLKQIFDDVRLLGTGTASELMEELIPLREQDVLLCLSFPRYARRMIQALAFAKAAGAGTIVLTDKATAPFAAYSDCTILAASDMVAFVDALTVPFSTVTALIVALAMRRKDVLLNHLEQLEEIWANNAVYETSQLALLVPGDAGRGQSASPAADSAGRGEGETAVEEDRQCGQASVTTARRKKGDGHGRT